MVECQKMTTKLYPQKDHILKSPEEKNNLKMTTSFKEQLRCLNVCVKIKLVLKISMI